MARLLIEDVTLIKGDTITVHVRFKGGAAKSLTLPRPLPAWELYRTPAETVAEIDHLLDHHTFNEVATILNARGLGSGFGKLFDGRRVAVVRRHHGLKSRYARLRELGLLTLPEVSERLGLHEGTVKRQLIQGRLKVKAYRLDDAGRHMFEDPKPRTVAQIQPITARPEEVQYAR